jgi:hypothetical protein
LKGGGGVEDWVKQSLKFARGPFRAKTPRYMAWRI